MSNITKYTRDAFKSLELVEDAEFNLQGKDAFQELDTYIDSDDVPVDQEVIDLEAETESELKDSYIGEAILSCPVCHTNLFKPIEDIVIGEDVELCCVGEPCPVCGQEDGFKIIGKVAPFRDTEEEEAEVEVEAEPDEAEVEVKEKVKESFRKRLADKKALREACEAPLKTPVEEAEVEEEKVCECDDKKLVEGRRWKYTLESGKELRQAIEEDEEPPFDSTLDALEKCLNELREYMTVENGFEEDDFDIEFGDIEDDIEVWRGDESEEAEDEINYMLSKFYDSCDGLGIWVPLAESLNEAQELDERLPVDLARAYKRANYNDYADVMVGRRSREYEFATGDPSKMTPKEVGPYIDYEAAEYTELTPEQAKKLPRNRWKDLRMLDGADLIVLTPAGKVNSRINDGISWNLRHHQTAPEVFDYVDKIYLTNEKSGDAFLSADQLSKRARAWNGVTGRHFTINSPEREVGKHEGDYKITKNNLPRDARYLDSARQDLEYNQQKLAELEAKYAAGDMSPNEYKKTKERLLSNIEYNQNSIANGETALAQKKQELQNTKAQDRYYDVQAEMDAIRQQLSRLIANRSDVQKSLAIAQNDLHKVQTGTAGDVHDQNYWWRTSKNINTKKEELARAEAELEKLLARIEQLRQETSDDAYAAEVEKIEARISNEQSKLAKAQADIDALLKRGPKAESLQEKKDTAKVKGTIAHVTQAHRRELMDTLNTAVDRDSLIKAFIDFINAHMDELNDEGKKRFELAKSQMSKMRNLSAIASFIGTLMTGLKVNESLDEHFMVYQFPKLDEQDIRYARRHYGLQDVTDEWLVTSADDSTCLRGPFYNLYDYAQDYLAYILVDGFLWDDEGNSVDLNSDGQLLDGDDFEEDDEEVETAFLEKKVCPKCGKEICECDKVTEAVDSGLSEADLAKVDDIADRYNASQPVSGSWKTEAAHELMAIRKELGLSFKEAVNVMVDYLGFDKDDLIAEVMDSLDDLHESLNEDIEKATIETADQVIEVSAEEKEEVEEDVGSDEEMIAPLSDEDIEEIEQEQPAEEEGAEDIEDVEDVESMEGAEEFPEDEELDFEDLTVQEESLNRLAEKYLTNTYSNVKSFKVNSAPLVGNELKVNGEINFNSGKTTSTTFMFEKVDNRSSIAKNSVKFVGLNETFTDKKDAFVLGTRVEGNNLIAESLEYEYPAKTKNLTESVKVVKGSVK